MVAPLPSEAQGSRGSSPLVVEFASHIGMSGAFIALLSANAEDKRLYPGFLHLFQTVFNIV